jgi:uncharacterized protein DUF6470
MESLLEIKTIPMSMKFKINKAHYEVINSNAAVEITRSEGGLEMHVKPIKLNIDTVETRCSAGVKNVIRPVENFAKQGIKSVYEATASYAKEGNMMLAVHIMNNPVSEIAIQKFSSDVSFNLGLPTDGYENTWDPQEISMEYEMDKLNFDWKINRPQISFIPGSIEFIIDEYPRVEINYIGTPIFVPPSADPNYKPIDTIA